MIFNATRNSGAIALVFGMLSATAAGCGADYETDSETIGGHCALGEDCGSSVEANVGPGDFGLDCNEDRRVKVIATADGDVIEARSCFYLSSGEIEYPDIANAYASIVDESGDELAQLPLPEASLVWLENGLGGHIWFYSAVYQPGAAAVDLYLRGHDTEDYVRIGSTDIPGTYEGDTFNFEDADDGKGAPVDLDWHGADYRTQGERL